MKSSQRIYLMFGVALFVSTSAPADLVMNYNLKYFCQEMFPAEVTAQKALHQDFVEFIRKRFEKVAFEKPEIEAIREKIPKRLQEIKDDLAAQKRGLQARIKSAEQLHAELQSELEPWEEIDRQTKAEVFAALNKRRADKIQPTGDFTPEEKESLKVAKEAIARINEAFLGKHGLIEMPDRNGLGRERANNEVTYKNKKAVYDALGKSLRFAERTEDFSRLVNACNRACSTPEAGNSARFDMTQTAWRQARWSQVVTETRFRPVWFRRSKANRLMTGFPHLQETPSRRGRCG